MMKFNLLSNTSSKRVFTILIFRHLANDYSSKYKSRLLELKILPLYVLDICDIMFFLLKALNPLQMHLISLTILNSPQETHDYRI